MAGYDLGRLNLNTFRNPLFISCALLYGLNVLFLQKTYRFWFLQNYLNDLLCLPLVLFVTVFLQRTLFRKPAYRLTVYQVGIAAVYFSVMFEAVIPLFNQRYTADFWDVICYCSGGLLFYLFGNSGAYRLVQKA
ncbi:hypothetical protein [Adhaeribacter soli]|uniref:Magnesium citrate secondary transporter n=1 Tax=Adhaeribacter soli TaxID=2607655 RepID=A0A5N1J4S3_9BACT|nr:hypothetical protein [Adhaeribacter soli]KAA9340079.1 hypothetical protein F0P94_06940 [Adhaeribacter soli]